MRKVCRFFAAGVMIAGVAVSSAWALDAGSADLDARMKEFRERFESRLEVSDRARALRSNSHSAFGAANDFIVNNDGFGGTSTQTQVKVARQSSGNAVVIWTDDRDANQSVYAQIMSPADTAIGPNFRMHTDPLNLNQFDPAIVMRPDNGFYAAYTVRKANGDHDVILQRFSAVGQPLGTPRNIASADSSRVHQRRPSIDLFANGDVLVVFERDSLLRNSDIWGRIFTKDDLTPVGATFAIARDLYNGTIRLARYDEREPSAAISGNDTIWVCWTDNRDGGARDVFGQRLHRATVNANATLIGSRFKINDEPVASNAYQNLPSICAGSDGSALVCWSDFRNGNWDIMKQSYAASGAKIGVNQIVNFSDASGRDQVQSACAWSDTTGVVTWRDFRGSNARIYYQRYHADGSAIETNRIAGVATTENESFPAAAVDPNGALSLAWSTPISAVPTAYLRSFDSANVGGPALLPADVIIAAKQVQSACAIAATGEIFTAWEESRAALPNIVGQAFNSIPAKVGGDVQLNGGPLTFHFAPSIGVGGTIGFGVWEDYRDTISPAYSDIYLQRFNLTAAGYSAVGGNVRVIDTVEANTDPRRAQWYPDIACDGNGRALAVWQDNRNGNWDIYGAIYNDSLGTGGNPVRIGRNARIDKGPGESKQELPRIDVNTTGQTVVIWSDNRGGVYTHGVYGRVYANTGFNGTGTGVETAGVEFMAVADSAEMPDVAVAAGGNFAVVYERRDSVQTDIYLQRFTSSGVKSGDPVLVSDDPLELNQFLPRVTATSVGYVVVWQDERNGNWDIYGSAVPYGSGPAGANFLVNDDNPTNQTMPMIAGIRTNDAPFIGWTDLRDFKTAPDIFGNRNAVTGIATGIGDYTRGAQRPQMFTLMQNYPNPFNPATEISYILRQAGEVDLTIFNALGQKVRTLTSGLQPAGERKITWDGRDRFGAPVASGTYFYRLTTPHGTDARKMTLIR